MLEEGAERADETRGRRRPGDHNGAATQRRIRDAVGQRGKHNPPGPAIPESGMGAVVVTTAGLYGDEASKVLRAAEQEPVVLPPVKARRAA